MQTGNLKWVHFFVMLFCYHYILNIIFALFDYIFLRLNQGRFFFKISGNIKNKSLQLLKDKYIHHPSIMCQSCVIMFSLFFYFVKCFVLCSLNEFELNFIKWILNARVKLKKKPYLKKENYHWDKIFYYRNMKNHRNGIVYFFTHHWKHIFIINMMKKKHPF